MIILICDYIKDRSTKCTKVDSTPGDGLLVMFPYRNTKAKLSKAHSHSQSHLTLLVDGALERGNGGFRDTYMI